MSEVPNRCSVPSYEHLLLCHSLPGIPPSQLGQLSDSHHWSYSGKRSGVHPCPPADLLIFLIFPAQAPLSCLFALPAPGNQMGDQDTSASVWAHPLLFLMFDWGNRFKEALAPSKIIYMLRISDESFKNIL